MSRISEKNNGRIDGWTAHRTAHRPAHVDSFLPQWVLAQRVSSGWLSRSFLRDPSQALARLPRWPDGRVLSTGELEGIRREGRLAEPDRVIGELTIANRAPAPAAAPIGPVHRRQPGRCGRKPDSRGSASSADRKVGPAPARRCTPSTPLVVRWDDYPISPKRLTMNAKTLVPNQPPAMELQTVPTGSSASP